MYKTTSLTFNIRRAVLFVAIAGLLLSAAFMPVQKAEAQSREVLMAQIQQLLQIVAELQAQLAAQEDSESTKGDGAHTSASVCPFTWTRNLNVGDRGEDVRKLQQFLNADPQTRVSRSGFGAPGEETTYYGNATANAVATFQEIHRSKVLSPAGLTNGSGYFGRMTREKVNVLCRGNAEVPDEDMVEVEACADCDNPLPLPEPEDACTHDGVLYKEGSSLQSIRNEDGSLSSLADASYVCSDGEWEIEGGFPQPEPIEACADCDDPFPLPESDSGVSESDNPSVSGESEDPQGTDEAEGDGEEEVISVTPVPSPLSTSE